MHFSFLPVSRYFEGVKSFILMAAMLVGAVIMLALSIMFFKLLATLGIGLGFLVYF